MATNYDNITLKRFNGTDWDSLNLAISAVSGLQTELDGKAPTVHSHAGTDITSGYVPTARLGAGTNDNTTFLRGDGFWAPNVIIGSYQPGVYVPAVGDMLIYGSYGWATQTPQEWAALSNNSFQYLSGLLATISSNTTTTVTGLSNYKWLIVELVAAGIRETRTIRYVAGQTVQISAYIAGTWRYINLQTNSGTIVSTGASGTPTVYVYGVR